MTVYVCAGMLNYETVHHKWSLLCIWYTRVIKLHIKPFHEFVGPSDGDCSILILVKELHFTHVIKNVEKNSNRARNLYRNVSRVKVISKSRNNAHMT